MSSTRSACFLALALSSAASAPRAFAYSEEELASVRSPQESQLRDLRLAQVAEASPRSSHAMARDRKADFYFRLAELYVEMYQAEFLNEGKVYDRKLRGAGERPASSSIAPSKKFLKKGVQACKELVDLEILTSAWTAFTGSLVSITPSSATRRARKSFEEPGRALSKQRIRRGGASLLGRHVVRGRGLRGSGILLWPLFKAPLGRERRRVVRLPRVMHKDRVVALPPEEVSGSDRDDEESGLDVDRATRSF